MPVMFALFVCVMLSFLACELPENPTPKNPGKLSCTVPRKPCRVLPKYIPLEKSLLICVCYVVHSETGGFNLNIHKGYSLLALILGGRGLIRPSSNLRYSANHSLLV